MAIAKKPGSNQADIDTFISGAPVRTAAPSREAVKEPTKDAKRVASLIRFPPDMLKKIDAAAKRRGLSRAGWLLMVASKALEAGE